MTECNNGDVRDLLPDFIAGTLPVAQLAEVDAHVLACPACRDEIALLRLVRSVRPRGADVDVARIAAALPRRTPAPALRLVRDEPIERSAAPLVAGGSEVVDFRSRRRPSRNAAWRIAAAIGVTVIGSWSVLSVSGGPESAGDLRVAAGSTSTDGAPDPAGLPRGESLASPSAFGDSGRGTMAIDASPAAGGETGVGLSLGDLSEYSDEELQRVLERLEQWDGATSADPLPTLPIVPVTRGTL